jgi:hypothetical protein
MKKYYIVFTSYSSGGYDVHGVFTKKSDGFNMFRNSVKDFLTYGPDDSTYLRLVKVELDQSEVDFLQLNDESDEIFELLEDEIWSRGCDELLVEGCDTIWCSIIPQYCFDNNLNPNNNDDFDKGREILFTDDKLFSKYVDNHIIKCYY